MMTDENPSMRLLPKLTVQLRRRHYTIRTQKAYCSWVKRYIRFHNMTHPAELSGTDVEKFLSHLAVERRCAPSTQKQALNALTFLYRNVLELDIGDYSSFDKSNAKELVPEVFSPQEIADIFYYLGEKAELVARIIYGGGLRVGECFRLRVKDIDFESKKLVIRNGKGGKDRITLLADDVLGPFSQHLEEVKRLHQSDLQKGHGRAPLPYSLGKKYPGLEFEWPWQFAFPSRIISRNLESGLMCRHHASESALHKAFSAAKRRAGIYKHAGPRNLRHSFATHMLMQGTDPRTLQKLLGHKKLKTTMVYLRIASDIKGLESPNKLLPPPRQQAAIIATKSNLISRVSHAFRKLFSNARV